MAKPNRAQRRAARPAPSRTSRPAAPRRAPEPVAPTFSDEEDDAEESWEEPWDDDGDDEDESDEDADGASLEVDEPLQGSKGGYDDDEDEDAVGGDDPYTRVHTAESYLAGTVLRLPSGGAFRIKPVSLTSLIQRASEGRKGGVPNTLLPAARRMLYGDNNRAQRRAAGLPASSADSETTIQLINFLVYRLVAQPRISRKPQDDCPPGTLSIEQIHEADKMAVAMYSIRGQRALEPFRR